MAYQILSLLWGGSEAPIDIKEGVISDPMLLYSIYYLIYLGSHAKNQPEISKFEQDFRSSKFCEIEIKHYLVIF